MPLPNSVLEVPGFPGYHVSKTGEVYSRWGLRRRTGGGRGTESYLQGGAKRLKLGKHCKGYLSVSLRKDGEYHSFLVHQLVLLTYVGPCPAGKEGCHDNGVKTDNRIENLYWGTRLENVQDSIRHGTHQRATIAAALVNRGKKRSEEFKAKLSAAKKGKKMSEQHRAAVKANHWTKRPDAAEIRAR